MEGARQLVGRPRGERAAVELDELDERDEQLSYLQLVDHIPQIVEELQRALADPEADARAIQQGKEHGRQRWRQGYELKEVVRELTLLRATLLEFFDRYRGALRFQSTEEFSRSYKKINVFIDDEIYKTVEAYLDAPHNAQSN